MSVISHSGLKGNWQTVQTHNRDDSKSGIRVSTVLHIEQEYLNEHNLTPLKLKLESSNIHGRRVHTV